MAQSAIDKIPPGPKLDALTAGKVFGWRKVHRLWSHFSDPHRIHELRREEKKERRQFFLQERSLPLGLPSNG